jgi:hypothetical protein
MRPLALKKYEEKNESCRKKCLSCKFGSAKFRYIIDQKKKPRNFQENVRSFHEVPKLEAFTVLP